MNPRPAASAAGGVHAALASPTRRRLLELLQASDTPRNVQDLAGAVGLHPSTVRFHLEMLSRAGLAGRQPHPQPGLGRPRSAYTAANRHRTDAPTTYRELAGLLAAHLADTAERRAARAEQIGFDWAQQLVPGGTSHTMDEAGRRVSGLFEQIGFEPELTVTGEDRQIALRACPFRVVAREHPEVVCSVHLGLLRGSLDRLGTHADGLLQPFVEPELCLAQLTPRG